MTGVLGRFVSLEMALLGLCELALSFLVIYGMLPGPDCFPSRPAWPGRSWRVRLS